MTTIVFAFGQADVVEVGLPVEVRRLGLKLGDGHRVVARRGIAQGDAVERALGERGLDGHDVGGFFGGLLGRVAEELEGLHHVVDVTVTKLLEALAMD